MSMNRSKRKAELKAAVISQLQSLIVPVIITLLIAAAVLVIGFYKPKEEPQEVIKVNSYDGKEKTMVLENDNLKFELDTSTTQFALTTKKDGAVWYSNPQDIDQDPLIKSLKLEQSKLKSTLLLTYSTFNGVDTLFNNYDYSMKESIYGLEQGDDYVKVCYSIGDAEKEYIVPPVLTEARMDELTKDMAKKESAKLKEYYKKYDINKLGKKDNKEELLEKYPILETEVIFVLRDNTKDHIKATLEKQFAEAGYTMEEYLEASGEAEGKESDKPVFNINVIYRLEGNDLVVEIPFEEIEYKSDYPIYYLSVLPYFGAGNTTDEGYMMVPEGGGALIHFNNGKVAQNSYYADMYGWDYAVSREALVHETEMYFNAFGIGKNGSGFICILEDGAPYAGIAADISGKQNSYNYVYPQYTMIHRESYEMGDRAAGAIFVYQKELPKNEKIVQRYRFIDSDSYSDMAGAYRSYLEENYPDNLNMIEDENAPLMIEVVGAIDKVKQILGIPVSRPLELTTYKEAKGIAEDLIGAGIENLSVKLSGWTNGGVQQKWLKKVKTIPALGSKKDLQSLSDYANENGISLYLNGITNYAYDTGILQGFFSLTDAARFLNREKALVYPYSKVTFKQRKGEQAHYLLRGDLIPKMVENLVKACDNFKTGVAFEDIGKELNSDYNRKNVITRVEVEKRQKEMLSELDKQGKNICINMGNYYAVPYVGFITEMDLSGSVYTIIDETAPIYQMAIHGYVNYCGEPLNLTQNQEQILLESAEYGAGLSFTVMDESAFSLQNTLYTEYFGAQYDSWKDKIIEIYSRYNEEMGNVFHQKMVNHEKVNPLVTATTYEDGTIVYVNYSYEAQKTPEGNMIPARDYLVVQG